MHHIACAAGRTASPVLQNLVFSTHNGLVERLIGSARHECTDHVIVLNEDHLRRILSKYASYYNEVRTHLSLGKDAPCTRPIEWFGDIIAQPILGGLHHRYARI